LHAPGSHLGRENHRGHDVFPELQPRWSAPKALSQQLAEWQVVAFVYPPVLIPNRAGEWILLMSSHTEAEVGACDLILELTGQHVDPRQLQYGAIHIIIPENQRVRVSHVR